MTADVAWEPLLVEDAVLSIAQDLFATMIDGEPGLVYPWMGEPPALEDARYTWVEVADASIARVVISTGLRTAEELTRALLAMPDGSLVSDADLTDAFGEIANVVCGNIKSMVTHPGTLSIPVVAPVAPPADQGACLVDMCLSWRGAPLNVSLWVLA